jgi:hypothetical protein
VQGRLAMLTVAERDKEAAPSATVRKERNFSKRVLDLCFLVGSALIVCVPGGGAHNSGNSSHQSHVGSSQPDIHGILCGRRRRVSQGISVRAAYLLRLRLACHKHGRNRGRPRFLWVTVFDSSSTRGAGSFLRDGQLVVRVAATFSASRTSSILKIMPAA